jgi:hypothetical protein
MNEAEIQVIIRVGIRSIVKPFKATKTVTPHILAKQVIHNTKGLPM